MSDSESNENTIQNEESDEELSLQENALLRYVWRSMALRNSFANRTNDNLVDSLVESNTLKTEKIINTFRKVNRAEFLHEDMQDEAYSDHPLRFSTMGFNTSAPHMFAMCLEALQIEEGDHFLDIGSGCGILTVLGGLLVGPNGVSLGLEIRQDIIELANKNLENWKEQNKEETIEHVNFELRNCFLIDPEDRKWDKIHVGACCPEFRLQYLFDCLNPGGKIVTPYGDELLVATKSNDGKSIERKCLVAVRYGDLIVPSEAEVRESILIAESKKREHINVPKRDISYKDSSSLFNNEEHSDFTLIVEGNSIPVHKIVLQNACEHFKFMFESGMRESTSKELIIEEFSYEQIISAVEVMYTGKCKITPNNAVELLEIANFYKLEWMKCKCEKVLHDNIEIETSAQIFAIADRFAAYQLRNACLEFILKNHTSIMMTKGFQELEKDLVIEIMKEACQRVSLSTSPK